MKAVIGVDLAGAYRVGLDLFARMKFAEPSIHFINVVEPLLPDGGFPDVAATSPMALILDDLQKAGTEVLSQATAEHPGSTSEVALGGASACIQDSAETLGAELIVVGSQEKSLIESIFIGSVTKALTLHSKQSVLIGKKQPHSTDGLVAVFAHDMSEYSDKALDHLLALAPQGLSKVVLVTADTTDPSIVAVVERMDPNMSGETFAVIESRLENRQADIAKKLKTVCSVVETVVSQGKANDVINETMDSVQADLLILGAHGHNLLERLVIGSVALHQVVREPHNVLIMRA